MTYNIFDDLPDEERGQMIADVRKHLANKGYLILSPDDVKVRDAALRSQAITDAAEVVLNGHGRQQTAIQLAIKLKNMAARARAV